MAKCRLEVVRSALSCPIPVVQINFIMKEASVARSFIRLLTPVTTEEVTLSPLHFVLWPFQFQVGLIRLEGHIIRRLT